MQTVAYTDIEHATEADIGRIALYWVRGNTLAIEDTLDECLRVANACLADGCTGEHIDRSDIDDHTDLYYLTSEDLVAVVVGEADGTENEEDA